MDTRITHVLITFNGMKIVTTLLNNRIAKLKVINSVSVTKKLPVFSFDLYYALVTRQRFYPLHHLFGCSCNEQHVSIVDSQNGRNVCVREAERERGR